MSEGVQGADPQLEALRAAGHGWSRDVDGPASGGETRPDLVVGTSGVASHPGDPYVRFVRAGGGAFRGAGPNTVRATAAIPRAQGPLGRITLAIKERVVGDPLSNEDAGHERLTKVKALAVLSSDAISSVAYATGAMLSVLLLAGSGSFGASIPIGGAIALLFAVVILSYRQTIKAYPKGGGSYIVASDNLGPIAGLTAGSSLMIDYVLTVAVSVVSGVAALTSLSPELSPYGVWMDLGFIALILLGNLRGIRESGTIFMLPSYAFIVGVYLMIVVGTVKFLGNGAHIHAPIHPVAATEGLSLFLVLRAFASGCTALTGVEAISDGVPAFQPPEWRNARTTITTLGVLAISMFLGITLLVHAYGLVPNPGDANPTLISMLNRATLGDGIGYFYVQVTTALILMLAANTAFSDFPRLAFFMARDGFLPHQFTHRGDRLSYSNGILVLAVLACVLILVFQGSFDSLINLYVIGVFASFTLSQVSMVKRWWIRREEGWRKGLVVNGIGTVSTAVVLVITSVTKFIYGAWLVVVLVPLMVLTFSGIRRHYQRAQRGLQPKGHVSPADLRHTVALAAGASAAGLLPFLRLVRPGRIVATHPRAAQPSLPAVPDLAIEDLAEDGRDSAGALLSAARHLGHAPEHQSLTVVLPGAAGSLLEGVALWRLRGRLLRGEGVAVAQVGPLPPEADGSAAGGHTTLVLVATLNQAGLEALAYARSLMRGRVLGVHLAAEEDRDRARQLWQAWGDHLPLVIIDSPYRSVVAPLLAYVDALTQKHGGEPVTVVIPMVLAPGLLGRVLHNHTANRIRRLLLRRPGTVVISVPHRLA